MEWLNEFGEWLKQAWVYLPAILSFISAIGFPSMVQIAKIFSSAKLYLSQAKTLKDKINVLVKTTNAFNSVCNELINNQVLNKEKTTFKVETKRVDKKYKTDSMKFSR